MKDSSLRLTLRIALACSLAFWLQTAGALPVSIGGVTTGNRGDTVSPILFDTVTDLEAADIKLTFDPVFLSFTGASAGTLINGFSVVAGAPTPAGSLKEVLISLASLLGPVSGGPGSILETSFLINNAAPVGTTSVLFETLDSTEYDFPATSAQITVTGPTAVPIGNSSILLLAGLAALGGIRRRLG